MPYCGLVCKVLAIGEWRTRVMLHYPPYYGQNKALASLELFATEVIPKFKAPAPKRKTA